MASLNVAHAVPITLTELATITVADGKDVLTIPFDCEISRVHMKLGDTGTTSGNNDVVVAYTKPTGGISTSGDLWTIGAGVGRIAYNASNKYLGWTRDSCAYTYLEAGGSLSLDVNVVAGGGTPGMLEVTLWVYPLNAS